MRLPQSIIQSLSVCKVHFLTIGIAIALAGLVPASAGQTTPQLACTPVPLRFGAVIVGQTESLLVTLTNSGQTSVTVSGITGHNPEFTPSSVSLPLVLPAGQSVDLSVSFAPAAIGWTNDTIEFSSNALNATLALNVMGTGVSRVGASVSPSAVSFGQVSIGNSSTVPVVLTNERSWDLTLSALQTAGSGFSVSGPALPSTLGAGQSVTLNVTFAPQSAETTGGSLFVHGAGMVIPLTGTGTAPQYSISLSWNPSSDVAGYNVYRSTTATGTYSKINSTLDANTSYSDGTVASGQTYYYAATSVSSSGQESTRSTPVQAAVP